MLSHLISCYHVPKLSLREKCPYSELFWSVFSRIRTEYGEIRSFFPYSVRMRANADPNNSKYGHLENRVHHNLFCKCRSSLRRFSFKKVFLKLSQNLGESTCSKVSFLKKKLKKRIWHRCFFVTFAKFLRTPFLKNASGQLLQQVAF